jgi:hypothetical protein
MANRYCLNGNNRLLSVEGTSEGADKKKWQRSRQSDGRSFYSPWTRSPKM